MKYKHKAYLSPKELPNRKRLIGEDANRALRELGLSYICVDDEGKTVALCRETKPLHGYYVYSMKVPDFT